MLGVVHVTPNLHKIGMTFTFLSLARRFRMALWAIIVAGVAVRAWLLFSTPWMPGINGAYYLVQARALLERGALGIPDMPLVFHLHAALAWLISAVFAQPPDAAIMLAVKCCDAVLPPLAGLPVFVLTRRWATHLGRPCHAVPLAAAALAVLSAPLMGMVGDYQKNSLALVWLAAFALALHAWLERHDARSGLWMLACVALLGLTHIGVLGSALLLAGVIVLFWFAFGGRLQRATVIWAVGAAVVLILSVLLVLWKFDAARVHRLVGAATNPADFVSAPPMPMPMPGGAFMLFRSLPLVLFAVATLPALWIVWRARREIRAADAAVVAGCALTALTLSGPWFPFEKAMRFQLIALIPGVLAGGFALLHITTRWPRNLVLGVTLLILIGPTLPKLLTGERPVLSDAALTELASLRPLIPAPDRSLISTQHGVEWWTAWLLRTRIAQGSALRPDDWEKFQGVYFLEVTNGLQLPGFLGGRVPGVAKPVSMPPPFMALPIPAYASIIHSGPHLKLGLVAQPPSSVSTKP